ncbi:Pathogenesis-related transcriptional factor and ERF protein [Oscillochloris trichoides DG-6]|uniref:Pathogenesis-related transcriptional factor and ERF protein n=1 Tax=Oscillochloris trichoides DG-6 TaxID=765420 RepID=E1IHU7_9CHLR|nr:AP2/ERF family transcription factor [Oscillochloris trichoides]EFO79222.1 Pathogenesis-related transcriptional factor and ERF protein [Oscillochloris trichoides DG-6]
MDEQFATSLPSHGEATITPCMVDDHLAALRYEPPPLVADEMLASLLAERNTTSQDEALAALRATAMPDPKTLPVRLRPKTTKHKGITRIDHPAKRTFGYFVRVTWNKQRRSKFFSDSVYGDRLAALSAALDWRNAAERELGKPRTERQVIGVSRTSTGIVGVRRTVKDGREVYEATWRDGNRIRRTSYSIAKHGERRALALARRAREKFEKARHRMPAE